MYDYQEVIERAKSEVGYHEGRSNGHWDNREKYAAQVPGLAWVDAQGLPWCQVFTTWVFNAVGMLPLVPVTASTITALAAWKAHNRFSEYPALGCPVFFGHNGQPEHTGIVVAYDRDKITTVEGNTNTNGSAEGDGVYLKTRARRDGYVIGYGLPAFGDGMIVSADPAFHMPSMARPTTPAPVAPSPAPVPAPPTHPDAQVLRQQAHDLAGLHDALSAVMAAASSAMVTLDRLTRQNVAAQK